MKLEDIFTNEQVVLEETKVYEQKDATEFDKETKHIFRVVYDPEAFSQAFNDIIQNDQKYPTTADKLKAITQKEPFWNKHIDKIKSKNEN